MKLSFLAAALLLIVAPFAKADNPAIIPLPAKVKVKGMSGFEVNRPLTASVASYPGDSIGKIANDFFNQLPGKVTIINKSKGDINFKLNKKLSSEAYAIKSTSKSLTIEASAPAGFFYGVQTIKQLLESDSINVIPSMEITDAPRFGWRGFMLDEGRHFYGKEEVKKILDMMALYKLNRFHWHLTEDQGWRIEIKKYPRLTQVGAWRDSERLGWGKEYMPEVLPHPYGGFYTQDDIREVVAYAKDRFIEIIPEIDIPGHTKAAVAAYPEILACDPEKPHTVWLWQGVTDDVINVANPAAVQMSKDILDEVISLFPFEYLHLGGDECPTNKWKANKQCQERLKQIGSTNFRDLQLDYYKQLQAHINAKPQTERRKLVFWNEVLYGNTDMLDNDITVMAWVGADKAALDAAQRGFETILTPQIPYYINRKQSKSPDEPRTQGHGTETLEAVYAYVPMNNTPAELTGKYKGVQANFWTEYVTDAPLLEYLMLPRLIAVAEAAWTPQDLREYTNFVARLQQHEPILIKRNFNYATHAFSKK